MCGGVRAGAAERPESVIFEGIMNRQDQLKPIGGTRRDFEEIRAWILEGEPDVEVPDESPTE